MGCPPFLGKTAPVSSTLLAPRRHLSVTLRYLQAEAVILEASGIDTSKPGAPAAYEGDDERDPETFDDTEFYQTLLKEFLEGSGAAANGGGNWFSVSGSLFVVAWGGRWW